MSSTGKPLLQNSLPALGRPECRGWTAPDGRLRARRPAGIGVSILSTLVLLGLHTNALAETTGYRTATTLVSAGNWTSFTTVQVASSDNLRATNGQAVPTAGIVTGFGLVVPDVATIEAISVRLKGSTGGTTVSFAIDLSWNGGGGYTAQQTGSFNSATDAVKDVPLAAGTWGRTWSASELANGMFYLRIIRSGSGTLLDRSAAGGRHVLHARDAHGDHGRQVRQLHRQQRQQEHHCRFPTERCLHQGRQRAVGRDPDLDDGG